MFAAFLFRYYHPYNPLSNVSTAGFNNNNSKNVKNNFFFFFFTNSCNFKFNNF